MIEIQRVLGRIILFVAGVGTLAQILTGQPIFGALATLTIGLGGFFLSFVDSKYCRYSQGFLFLLTSYIIIFSDPKNFIGSWFLTMSFVVLFKFGFFDRHTKLKLSIILALSSTIFIISYLLVGSFWPSFGAIALLLGSVLIMYFVFEIPHKRAKELIEQQDTKIAYLEPLSKIGERGASIVHSIKNKLAVFDLLNYLLEEDIKPKEEIVEEYKEGLNNLNDVITGILSVSTSGKEDIELFNISDLVDGACTLFLQDRLIIKYVKLIKNIEKGVLVLGCKKDILLAIENIMQNAVDQIKDTTSFGEIHVTLTSEFLTLSNNAGAISTCTICNENCNKCPVYTKIGKTTKKYGTGNGISQIIRMCNDNNWILKIKGYSDITSFTFYFKGE